MISYSKRNWGKYNRIHSHTHTRIEYTKLPLVELLQQFFYPGLDFTNSKKYTIGLYTPINYYGRYATCSHKDGGCSMFSLGKPLARRTTWYAYNYVGARKFKSCFFEPLTRRVFSINTSSSSTLFLFDQNSPQQQHHASQTFIYKDNETLSRLWETDCFKP